jgi:hypothetical protein
VTGPTVTGTVADAPVVVVTGIDPLVTEAPGGTIKVGTTTADVGTTLAGTVNPGSATVTVAPKNPAVTLTGGTNCPAHPDNKRRVAVNRIFISESSPQEWLRRAWP